MRKIYHTESSSVGLAASIAISAGLTAVLFSIIPFTHIVAQPGRHLELRKTSATDLPPPVEEQVQAPPPEAEKPPEAPPAPQVGRGAPADTPQR